MECSDNSSLFSFFFFLVPRLFSSVVLFLHPRAGARIRAKWQRLLASGKSRKHWHHRRGRGTKKQETALSTCSAHVGLGHSTNLGRFSSILSSAVSPLQSCMISSASPKFQPNPWWKRNVEQKGRNQCGSFHTSLIIYNTGQRSKGETRPARAPAVSVRRCLFFLFKWKVQKPLHRLSPVQTIFIEC